MDDLTPELARSPAKPEEPDTPPPRKVTRLRKFLKRASFVGIGLLIIAVVIFFMLPVWMSNEQGRNYLLSRFNKRINGKVEIGGWKLSWFSGTEIKNLVITGADGKVILSCPSVKTDLTLWSLLWGNYTLGNTTIYEPHITAAKYADGTNDFSRLILPNEAPGPNPLQTLSGYIKWENGEATFSGPTPDGPPIVVKNFTGGIPIASNSAPVHLSASGTSAGSRLNQQVSLVADLPPPMTWTDNPFALLTNLRFTGEDLPTAPIAEWLGLSPHWQDSIGPVLTSLSIATEPRDATTSVLTVSLRGTAGSVDARALIMPQNTTAGRSFLLALASEKNAPPLSASLRLSQPMIELLAHINPLFIGITKINNAITFQSPDLSLDLMHPETASGRVLVTFPGFTLTPSPLMKEILAISSTPQAREIAIQDINGINLSIAKQRITSADIVLTLPSRQRLTFSGSVGFDGSLDLLLKTPLPSPSNSASVSTVTLPITGNVHSPHIEKP